MCITIETQETAAISISASLDMEHAITLLDGLPELARAADANHRRALFRMIYDQVWLDREGLWAVRPTPLYLPLVVTLRSMLEWHQTTALQKSDGQDQP